MDEAHQYLNIMVDLVKTMVPTPELVVYKLTQDERGLCLTFDISPEDRGKVIGKQGKTVEALRTIAHVIGALRNARVGIVVND